MTSRTAVWALALVALVVASCGLVGQPDVDEEVQSPPSTVTTETDGASDGAVQAPASKVTVSTLQRSRVVTSTLPLSEVEREVLDTLAEFDAVDEGESTTMTVPDNVLFDFDSAELRPGAAEVIGRLATAVTQSEGPVRVVGHTDTVGTSDYNQRLSEERAQAVADAFVADHGIDEIRLHTDGKGETEPIAPNTRADGSDNPEGRQRNRRVEVTLQRVLADPGGTDEQPPPSELEAGPSS